MLSRSASITCSKRMPCWDGPVTSHEWSCLLRRAESPRNSANDSLNVQPDGRPDGTEMPDPARNTGATLPRNNQRFKSFTIDIEYFSARGGRNAFEELGYRKAHPMPSTGAWAKDDRLCAVAPVSYSC